jgi:hypothetical protein
MRNRKQWLIAGALLLAAAVVTVGVSAGSSDQVVVAALVNEMTSLSQAQLASLEALPLQPYTLPKPGVDVMRVQLDESYTIDGIGEDTVELTGWIAVTHGKPTTDNWATAITDTQFVAMDLVGTSKVFGRVHVTLDSTRPAVGQVGRITVPEHAHYALASASESETSDIGTEPVAVCRAPVAVNVSMQDLGLEMTTKDHAVWYSEVTTIPPVGHQASVTVDPIRMVSNGREVGTLTSGIVKFREVVRHLPLSPNAAAQVASK